MTESPIEHYQRQVRQIPCRFCHVGPDELCVKPDPLHGQPECGQSFLPRFEDGYSRRCTVRGQHTTHAALPPRRVEVVAYVHDDRSMDHLAMTCRG